MCPLIAKGFFSDCASCWMPEECAEYGKPELVK